MKWIFFVGLLLLISACTPTERDQPYVPSGVRDVKNAGPLQVQLFVNPDPRERNLTIEDGLQVGLYFVNRDKDPIQGIISLEDTPNEEQFGGLIGRGLEDFEVPGMQQNKAGWATVFPGSQPIFYEDDKNTLKSTSFVVEVRYHREIEFTSDEFWMRKLLNERPRDCKKNCDEVNSVASNHQSISTIREKLFDFNGDFQVDSMQLEFSLEEGSCEIISYEKAQSFEPVEEKESVFMELSLQQSGPIFACNVKEDSSEKRKAIICLIDNSLQGGDYADRVMGKIKYGCKLLLKSGEIQFGSKED